MIDNQSESGAVIVGVDGSERSIDALALADLLAPALGRQVTIAYVHPYGKLSSVFSEGEHERVLRGVAESTFDQVREHLPSVAERRMQLVSAGSAAAGIHTLAQREAAALIVIGSSHRSSIGRILIGGTGERLLSGAPAPVAVAPAGYAANDSRLQTIGCGFDSTQEAQRALAWAAQLARDMSARLRVLSVFEPVRGASLTLGHELATTSINDVLRQRRSDALARALSGLKAGIEVRESLLDGDAGAVLARESADLDLLVVGSRGYGPLRAALLGSVSSALVRSAASPLVVVPRGAHGESAA